MAQAETFLRAFHRQIAFIDKAVLSGSAAQRDIARVLIAAQMKTFDDIVAADLIERTKQWIEQVDEDHKKEDWIVEIHRRAKSAGDGSVSDPKWWVRAASARAMRYAGRFRRAHKRYLKSIKRIETIGGPRTDEMAHVYADYAEHLAYLGFAEDAVVRVNQIPAARRYGWHLWIKAFAQHQLAFAKKHPYPGPASTDGPGARRDYKTALRSLDAAIAVTGARRLSASERRDTNLLRAACWGQIYRTYPDGSSSDAQQALAQATSARDAFLDAPDNALWTVEKEMRGRMPVAYYQFIDCPSGTPGTECIRRRNLVPAWRAKLQEHWHIGLVTAGFPLTAGNSDGWVDPLDDHSDDTDEED